MTKDKELKLCPFCGDCKYYYDGYCVNSDSDYCSEWVDDDFGCKNWMRGLTMINDIHRIADHYGFNSQLIILIEEMSETTKAITKLIRIIEGGQTPSNQISKEEAVENATEEIADVEIMLEQVKYLLNIPEEKLNKIKITKIKRTLDIMGREND